MRHPLAPEHIQQTVMQEQPMTEMNPMFLKQRSKSSKVKSNLPDGVKENAFFDTIAVQFHFSIFLYQFVSHIILPLLLFVPNRMGQGVRWEYDALRLTILIPIGVYLMIICYFCASDSDQKLLGGSLWIPIMYFISHRIILSLKYASLSPTEYQRFNTCRDLNLCKSYSNQMQIITGWTFIDQSVLHFELGAAAARLGVKINEIYLRIPGPAKDLDDEQTQSTASSQLRYWNAFVRGHELIDWDSPPAPELRLLSDGSHVISVYDVLLAVLRKCTTDKVDPMIPYAQYLVAIIALSIIIISYVPVLQNWKDIDSIPLIIIFLVASTEVNWIFGKVFYFILYTAIVDVKRMLRVFRTLHYMIRLSDLMMDKSISLLRNTQVSYCDQQMATLRAETIFAMGDHNEQSLEALLPPAKERSVEEKEKQEAEEERESIVLGEFRARNHAYALIPRISFHYPQNIITWTYCRVAMQHFGDRFRARIDSYVGGMCLVAAVLMLSSILNIGLATDQKQAFQSTLFVQSLLAVSIIILFLSHLFFLGAQVNDELNLQKLTLVTKQLQAEQQRTLYRHAEDGEEDTYEQICESISTATEILSTHSELKPFKLLGMDAQMALVISIATTALTFYSTLLTMYVNVNSSDSAVDTTSTVM